MGLRQLRLGGMFASRPFGDEGYVANRRRRRDQRASSDPAPGLVTILQLTTSRYFVANLAGGKPWRCESRAKHICWLVVALDFIPRMVSRH